MSAMLKDETLQQQAVRELHQEVYEMRMDREKREREYCNMVTLNCVRAIAFAADAANAPRVSTSNIQEAREALAMAAHYAELLKDMEEE